MRLGIVSDFDFYSDGNGSVYVNRGQHLIEYLSSKLDEVVYFGRLVRVDDASELLPVRSPNFRVVPLRQEKRTALRDGFAVAKRFLAAQGSCDVFLVKLGNLHALVAFVLLKLRRRPVICYAINDLDLRWHRFAKVPRWYRWRDRMLRHVWRLVYILGDARLAVSPTVAAHYKLLGLGSDARVYVETALSPQFVGATPGNSQAGEPMLLSVGRLVAYKGHSFLIQALHKLVRREGLRARLLIVGDGPLRHELQGLVTALGLGNWVHLIRHVPQGPKLWEHYRSASIYVQPSLTESFGMAVLEGMYFGLPVVASRVGGLPDIVQHGETGILVPPGDAEALASALATLLRSPDLRQRMGSAGRAVALRYTLEGETDALLGVLRKVAKGRQIREAARSRAGSGG